MRTWEEFMQMVDLYRALGYRIVEFEAPDEGEGTSAWICAFDTHGVNADEIPIESFANELWLETLRGYAAYGGPVSEVWHADVTDDPGEMSNFDWCGNYSPLELVR